MDIQVGEWLVLTDYAAKHRISVSTLRRRIKANQIEFKFDDGKYFLRDVPPPPEYSATAHLESPPSLQVEVQNDGYRVHLSGEPSTAIPLEATEQALLKTSDSNITVAHKLFSELKKAYSSILHEKEEQIVLLKEEVADLKTLVRVLEDDHDRLKRMLDMVSLRRNQ